MTNATDALRARLQKQCVDWDAYWREPDAHGVILSPEQATELLADALGVEVEITATPAGSASGEVQRYFRGEYGMVAAGPEYPHRDGDTYWVAEQDYAALQAEVARLRECQRLAEMFQQFVIGEGAWERFHALTVRAEAAEAEAARLREDAEPFEMYLCEAPRVLLKPLTLYRFTIDPKCEACCRAADRAAGSE